MNSRARNMDHYVGYVIQFTRDVALVGDHCKYYALKGSYATIYAINLNTPSMTFRLYDFGKENNKAIGVAYFDVSNISLYNLIMPEKEYIQLWDEALNEDDNRGHRRIKIRR